MLNFLFFFNVETFSSAEKLLARYYEKIYTWNRFRFLYLTHNISLKSRKILGGKFKHFIRFIA